MKKLKDYICFACMVIAAISFFVMIWGWFIHPAIYGFWAGLICGLSFTVGLFIGIPDDEDKGIIDYGRNLG
jgi:hypothetical protein